MEIENKHRKNITRRKKDELEQQIKVKDARITTKTLSGKSEILRSFLRVVSDGVETSYTVCQTCNGLIKFTPTSGTSGLLRHSCKRKASDSGGGETQPKISSFTTRQVPEAVKSRVTDSVVQMCSQDIRPFAIVEGQGFVSFVQELLNIGAKYGSSVKVEDVLPSERTVSRHVGEQYEKIKKRVVEELQKSPEFAVTTDLWTEKTNTHYITITVHYIMEWRMVNRVLATREILGVKTHENIRRTSEAILQEFGVYSKDVIFVTDNGSNVVAAFKDYIRLSCSGHNINLILKHTFDHLDEENPLDSPIINLFRDAKTLVTHFKRAGLQKGLDRSLKQAVETRWNTRLAMLQSIRDALQSGKLHEILIQRNELRFVNNIDPDLLNDIINLLEPFDEATRHLSTDQTPTLHLVLPTKATLMRSLALQDGDSDILKQLKGKLCQAVELKFKIHLYHKIATALSPSLRSFVRKSLSAVEYEEVVSSLAALTDSAGTDETAHIEHEDLLAPVVTEVHNFFASCVQVDEEPKDTSGTNKESQGRQEVLKYMNETLKITTGSQSLLAFWQEMSSALVPVARKMLAIPATSAPSERSFSIAGRLVEERRTALSPENVDSLLFLHSNLPRC